MSKYKDYLKEKYGTDKKLSIFEAAEERKEADAKRNQRLANIRHKRDAQLMKIRRRLAEGDELNPDNYWLEIKVNGRTIFYKDSIAFDADTGERVDINAAHNIL